MAEQKKNIWRDFRPKRRKPLPGNPLAGVLALAVVGVIGFCLGVLVAFALIPHDALDEARSVLINGGLAGAAFAVGLGLPGLRFLQQRRPEEDEKEQE